MNEYSAADALIELKKRNDLKERFYWRSKDGQLKTIEDMDTRHLFNTVLMIWNHSMPIDARIEPFIKYSFGSFYTEAYFMDAIRFMIPELGARNDKTEWQSKTLYQMAKYFVRYQQKEIDEGRKLLGGVCK